jgi:predicted nucleic acid-binding protein
MSKLVKYCWDTSVFIAWIAEEEDKPLADIGTVADEISSGKAVLIVPVTIYSEILETRHTEEQLRRFEQFLKRSEVIVADTTVPIAQKASAIRSKGEAEGRKIKTPDATVLATAILYKADVLHSFDPHLLNLNGSSIVDGLRITKPISLSGQHGLV